MNTNDAVNILLVDDDPAQLLALEAVLETLGQRCVRAGSGSEALKQILRTDFAVILLDVRMPDISGFDTARLIREHPRTSHVPIIFVTASDDTDFPVEKAYALGAVDYLTKPVIPAVLRGKIAFFVDLHRKNRELARIERERHAAALSAKDERIRLILGNTKEYAFVVTDAHGNIMEWEGGAARITGWSPTQAIGQSTDLIYTLEDCEAGCPQNEMERAREFGRAEDKRWYIRKDGSRFFADGVMVSLKDEAGQLRGYAKIFHDATKERLAGDALKASENRLRLSTEAAELGLWVWDSTTDQVKWENERLFEIFGFSPEDAPTDMTSIMVGLMHPEDAPALRDALDRTLATGDRLRFQGRFFRRPERDLRWIDMTGLLQLSVDEDLPRILGTAADITDRKRAEERLRASEERYRTLFESMDEGFCVVELLYDCDGNPYDYRFLEINPAFEKHTGLANAVGKTIRELVPDHDAHWFETYGRVAQTGEAVRFEEQAKAMGRWFDVYALRLGEQGSTKVAVLFTDITARKHDEDALRQLAADLSTANRRKTEFLAILAHELRNPLAPIRSGLELMRLAGDNAETVARVREMMDRQLGHLVHLVDDLLDIARITANKLELKKQRVDLRSLVKSAVESSQPLIEGGGHAFSVTLPEQALFLDVDPIRIAQVIGNLLNNAAKYTPPGGVISLSASHVDDHVVISVTDTGVGIPEEALATVFDMFTQVERASHSVHGGLGIGLSLVRRLVEQHGGTVSAASPGLGKGCIFTVRLPLAAPVGAPDAAADAYAWKTMEPPPRALRVLVADDNMDAAGTLAALLEQGGHSVRLAGDGFQALKVARAFQPDIAFLDIGMPGMNGYEVARAFRQLPASDTVVLVAVTGWGTEDDRAQSRAAGFNLHLTKPVSMMEIEQLLAAMASSTATTEQ